jgi:hypothetical protein
MTRKRWITAAAFGLPFSLIMIVYNSFRYQELSIILTLLTLILGLILGLVFTWSMEYMAKRFLKRVEVQIGQDEIVVREAGANYFRGVEGVGGKLVLTNRRLIFKSHKSNIQNHQWDFDLSQIEKIDAARTWNLFKNGLMVLLAGNETHKFVVAEPDEWANVITRQKLPPRIA